MDKRTRARELTMQALYQLLVLRLDLVRRGLLLKPQCVERGDFRAAQGPALPAARR